MFFPRFVRSVILYDKQTQRINVESLKWRLAFGYVFLIQSFRKIKESEQTNESSTKLDRLFTFKNV